MISFFSFFMVIFEGKSVIWSFSAKFIPKKPPFWSEKRTYSQSTPLGVCKNCPFMQLILWKVTIANVVILKKKKKFAMVCLFKENHITLFWPVFLTYSLVSILKLIYLWNISHFPLIIKSLMLRQFAPFSSQIQNLSHSCPILF